jgi:copper resistance protein D
MTILQILVAARWVHFSALFVLFGCPLSFLLTYGINDADRVSRATDRLLRVAAVVAAISGFAWIAALIANMAGGFAEAATSDTLSAFFFETQFGPIVIVRLILLAAAVLAIVLPRYIRFKAWLLIAAALLIDQAWLGHAAHGGASLSGAMMIAAYAVHVLAGAAWVGGLPVLLFVLLTRGAAGDNVTILSRYSILATAAVVLILLSGAANALFRVQGHIARLTATDYGEILLVKLLLVAVMLVLASYNRFIALPRLGPAKRQKIASSLAGSIGAELALGVIVIGAAALLGITPPPN